MKITNKILSLPPYVSTSWRDVQSIHQSDGVLVVSFLNGESVRISNLSTQTLETIFAAHAAYLEEEAAEEETALTSQISAASNLYLDNVHNMLQHNPLQANAPQLPQEMLLKIAEVAKFVIPDDPEQIPSAEPHCNCMHCQIARAISGAIVPLETQAVENKAHEVPVEEEELRFRQWDIKQAADQVFMVTNRLDENESYRVFLGSPVGCTCGQPNCEHIVAVLQS